MSIFGSNHLLESFDKKKQASSNLKLIGLKSDFFLGNFHLTICVNILYNDWQILPTFCFYLSALEHVVAVMKEAHGYFENTKYKYVL